MTKVKMTPALLQYFRGMVERVKEVCEENAPAEEDHDGEPGLVLRRMDIEELWVPGLLEPPKIQRLWPDLYLTNGRLEGIIQIHTCQDSGVMNVYVTLEDDQGNYLEGDYATVNADVKNHWRYSALAPANPGTTITVRAIAMDRLGGVAIQQENITV
jgi:hypothetical protein